MNPRLRTLASTALFCSALAASTLGQTTWYVDDDAPNDPGPGDPLISDPLEDGSTEHPFDAIQEAIDACANGDTVLLADGTYAGEGNRNIELAGEITVQSANGPESCVIDVERRGRAFLMRGATLVGLTITGGQTIDAGGGVLIEAGGYSVLKRCVLMRNFAHGPGGAVAVAGGQATIKKCTLLANASRSDGGGVGFVAGGLREAWGCRILNNTSMGVGGGVACLAGDPAVINCVVAGNEAAGGGGGVWLGGNRPQVIFSSILDNSSGESGGGVCLAGDAESQLGSSIVWGNRAAAGAECAVLDEGTLSVDYCNVRAGSTGILVGDLATLEWLDGNIDIDPLVAFEHDPRLMVGSPCIDAATNWYKPAYDAEGKTRNLDGDGDREPWTGKLRTTDMGAYEYDPESDPRICASMFEHLYNANENEPVDGSSWLSIRNPRDGEFNWQLAEDCDWVTLSVDSGHVSDEIDSVRIDVDTDGLPDGWHHCPITLTADGVSNSPLTIVVTIDVRGILKVPSEHPTIQAGIDATWFDRDVVVVADGMYTGEGNKNLTLRGRNIVVKSAYGPEACVIDCEGDGSGFRLDEGEPDSAVIEGFWITGAGDSGVYSTDTRATVRHCVIDGNTGVVGGGVRTEGDIRILHCTISGNTAVGDSPWRPWGGGIGALSGRAYVAHCDIVGNHAWYGGGIATAGDGYTPSPDLLVEDCLIAENSAIRQGGGVFCEISNPVFRRCLISGNTAGRRGGGVAVSESQNVMIARPVFVECDIIGNEALPYTYGSAGGGLYLRGGDGYCAPTVVNCTIADNLADHGGGVLAGECRDGGRYGRLINCTIASNAARNLGGGLYVVTLHVSGVLLTRNTSVGEGAAIFSTSGSPKLWNCVIWDNPSGDSVPISGSARIQHSNIQGGHAGEGNIDLDPLFVDSEGPDGDPNTWEDNDYRLLPGSPCIDAGTNLWAGPDIVDLDGDGDVDERTPLDMSGLPRFMDDNATADTGVTDPPNYPEPIDIGPHEFVACLGDISDDFEVDLEDLALMLDGYGQTTGVSYHHGDLNGDGRIDLADLATLLAAYAEGCD